MNDQLQTTGAPCTRRQFLARTTLPTDKASANRKNIRQNIRLLREAYSRPCGLRIAECLTVVRSSFFFQHLLTQRRKDAKAQRKEGERSSSASLRLRASALRNRQEVEEMRLTVQRFTVQRFTMHGSTDCSLRIVPPASPFTPPANVRVLLAFLAWGKHPIDH